ncbi:MAG: hypothetical protein EXQ52_17600, partial [Bryobacterales bacterium]|nr:hypothetical protein [Bryobacterales bacterium]
MSTEFSVATQTRINDVEALVFDSAGNLHYVEFTTQRVRKISPSGIVTSVAGSGGFGYSGDGGPALQATFRFPTGVAVGKDGVIYISDTDNNKVRKATNGIIETFAGTVTTAGDGGPAVSAQLLSPRGVAVDASGNLLIADSSNSQIRRVDTTGKISTIAGNGVPGFKGDRGPASAAQVIFPRTVVVDSGNYYIVERYRIRKVDAAGIITTVAGNGSCAFDSDNRLAPNASLCNPYGIAFDRDGNMFIADTGHHRIRRVTVDGVITTVAGTGTPGFRGDAGPATAAQIDTPTAVAVDRAGNLYIADQLNARIRKVDPAGIISTVAGTGSLTVGGDGGQAMAAGLGLVSSLAI